MLRVYLGSPKEEKLSLVLESELRDLIHWRPLQVFTANYLENVFLGSWVREKQLEITVK